MNIDANRSYVGLADNGTIATPIKVDATSGRLLVAVNIMSSSTAHTTNKIDENRTSASLVYDGTTIRPLLVDSSGNLIIDLNVE